MADLTNIRLRHASLIAVHSHIKNYVECLERGYYGKNEDHEKNLIKILRKTLKDIDESLWKYYDEESKFGDE